jgi:hypothetical protein
MFHGGTTFGFMAGANINFFKGSHYKPDVTSYGMFGQWCHILIKKVGGSQQLFFFVDCFPLEAS